MSFVARNLDPTPMRVGYPFLNLQPDLLFQHLQTLVGVSNIENHKHVVAGRAIFPTKQSPVSLDASRLRANALATT